MVRKRHGFLIASCAVGAAIGALALSIGFATHAFPLSPALSHSMETATPALMRAFAENIKRQIVVGPKAGWEMSRDAVISRVIETIKPHPDVGLPRLWSQGLADRSLTSFPWPLLKDASAYPAETSTSEAGAVVPMRKRGG